MEVYSSNSYSLSSSNNTLGSLDLSVSLNGTDMNLIQNGFTVNSTPISGTLLDNSNPIIFDNGQVFPIITGANITKDGVLAGSWAWQNTSGNFTDLSGNGNDMAPSYRSSGSNSDITAVLASMAPISQATAPAYSISDPTPFIAATTNISGDSTVNVSPKDFPGKALIDAVAAAGATPEQVPYVIIATFLILALSLATSGAMRNIKSNGSMFIKLGVIIIGCAFARGLHIYSLDMIVFIIVFGIAFSMASTQRW